MTDTLKKINRKWLGRTGPGEEGCGTGSGFLHLGKGSAHLTGYRKGGGRYSNMAPPSNCHELGWCSTFPVLCLSCEEAGSAEAEEVLAHRWGC